MGCPSFPGATALCSHSVCSKKGGLVLPQLRSSFSQKLHLSDPSATLGSLCCPCTCASFQNLKKTPNLEKIKNSPIFNCVALQKRGGEGWEGEMGRSYFSANPSALVILHPAPIITGCAGWPGQGSTFPDFPGSSNLPVPACPCWQRGGSAGALGEPPAELQVRMLRGAQPLPRARPSARRQLHISGRAISAPMAPQHVGKVPRNLFTLGHMLC